MITKLYPRLFYELSKNFRFLLRNKLFFFNILIENRFKKNE